ncbi:MAG: DUF1326 domain-containing protein [Chloroflexi bacterium]|nr:DUF1326 domain-containing protein [Chloroflexota bacterium]
MAWRVSGDYVENCNCEVACPCTVGNFGLPATYDSCKALFGFHIESGEIDDVDVSGLTVALVVVDSPKNMIEGGWRLGMFLDDGATSEQSDKLSALFSGQLGGPPAGLAPLIGEFLGAETQPIEYREEGRRRWLTIGDRADLDVEEITSPVDAEAPAPQLVGATAHPAGAPLTIARGNSRFDGFGVQFTNEGKSAFTTRFSWAG